MLLSLLCYILVLSVGLVIFEALCVSVNMYVFDVGCFIFALDSVLALFSGIGFDCFCFV